MTLATEMRDIAIEKNKPADEVKYAGLIELIKMAAHDGEYSIIVHGRISDVVTDRLVKDGFFVYPPCTRNVTEIHFK